MPSSWKLISLWMLRVLLVFSSGYIHPDEFFQSPAITAHSVLHTNTHIPWEFRPSGSFDFDIQRSIIVPYLSTGLPFRLLKFMFCSDDTQCRISSRLLLYTPRLLTLFTAFIVEWLLNDAVSSSLPQHRKTVSTKSQQFRLLFNCLWPVLVFHCRTFSNTWETLFMAITVTMSMQRAIQTRQDNWNRTIYCIVLGAICGAGVFTRFTFPFFAWPFCLITLVSSSTVVQMPLSRISKFYYFVRNIFDTTLGFLCTCSAFIVFDTLFFTPHQFTVPMALGKGIEWTQVVWVIAPVNNFIYNSKPENLSLHGTHPRWLHGLVNFPMLYGPLAIWFYWACFNRLMSKARRHHGGNDNHNSNGMQSVLLASLFSIFSGIAFLSTAPHQEPRFLIPLSVPLSIVALYWWNNNDDSSRKHKSRNHGNNHNEYLSAALLAFGLIMSVFYGGLHQAGVVPVLHNIQSYHWHVKDQGSQQLQQYFFYKTYMPPTHLLNVPVHDSSLIVHDLAGSSWEVMLRKVCTRVMAHHENADDVETVTRESFLVTPGSVLASNNANSNTIALLDGCERLRLDIGNAEYVTPHISTEDLPRNPTSRKQFSLAVIPIRVE